MMDYIQCWRCKKIFAQNQVKYISMASDPISGMMNSTPDTVWSGWYCLPCIDTIITQVNKPELKAV
jgi:hypothetical protein